MSNKITDGENYITRSESVPAYGHFAQRMGIYAVVVLCVEKIPDIGINVNPTSIEGAAEPITRKARVDEPVGNRDSLLTKYILGCKNVGHI